ncbi:MAG: protein TonB [Candidatus Azotimanducaceae bacterium]|jgi:protein TonB
MRYLQRMTGALAMAALITTSLFYLMNYLIQSDGIRLEKSVGVIVDLVRVKEMEPVKEIDRVLKPEPVIEPPPKPAPSRFNQSVLKTANDVTLLPLTTTAKLDFFSDGEYLPLVKVQPAYPRRALARGVSGYTIVEFDISEQGFVQNPRVIEAIPSEIFNATSLKTIAKYKYRPKVIDGKPVTVKGVRNKFVFELSEG